MSKYFLFLFFFPLYLIGSEPPWKEAVPQVDDFPGRPAKPGLSCAQLPPQRVEASSDLRKEAAKNSYKQRISKFLNCCKGGK